MKRTQKNLLPYESPEVEIIELKAEQCFATSPAGIDDLSEEYWSW